MAVFPVPEPDGGLNIRAPRAAVRAGDAFCLHLLDLGDRLSFRVVDEGPGMSGEVSCHHQIELAARLSEGRPLRCVVSELCERVGVRSDAAADLLLVTSEAFNNAVRYGTTPPEGSIRIAISIGPREATVSLEYSGDPFPQDPPYLPDTHSTGGRGRFLIARLTDQADYCFSAGRTHLRLVKRW